MNYQKRTQNEPNFALHPTRCQGKANFRRQTGFQIETLRLLGKYDGLGWAEQFIAYSTPLNCSAKGGRDNKEQH